MLSMKGYLSFQFEMAYIATVQQIYCHEKFIAHSCRGLANYDHNEAYRYLLSKLANIADRRALHYEVRLRLSGASLPLEKDTWSEILWRWLFMRCGIRCLMKWIDWIQQDDISKLGSLLLVQKLWRNLY